jgi:hypothetical protein
MSAAVRGEQANDPTRQLAAAKQVRIEKVRRRIRSAEHLAGYSMTAKL